MPSPLAIHKMPPAGALPAGNEREEEKKEKREVSTDGPFCWDSSAAILYHSL